jgi:hypothetical protein
MLVRDAAATARGRGGSLSAGLRECEVGELRDVALLEDLEVVVLESEIGSDVGSRVGREGTVARDCRAGRVWLLVS